MKRLIPILLMLVMPAAGCSGKKDGDDKSRGADKDFEPPYGTKTAERRPTSSGRKTSQPALPTGPALSLTSKQYREEFQADYGKAQKKFKNRLVELTGPVARISQYDDDPAPRVSLEGVPGKTDDVQLHFRDPSQWKKVIPGQTVKVRGRPAETLAASNLELCEVVEVGGGPTAVTADALVAEIAADQKAAAKYHGKPLVVTGEVASAEAPPDDKHIIKVALKAGKPKPTVTCSVTIPLPKELLGTVKPGQKVKVWAKEIYIPDADKVLLLGAILYDATE